MKKLSQLNSKPRLELPDAKVFDPEEKFSRYIDLEFTSSTSDWKRKEEKINLKLELLKKKHPVILLHEGFIKYQDYRRYGNIQHRDDAIRLLNSAAEIKNHLITAQLILLDISQDFVGQNAPNSDNWRSWHDNTLNLLKNQLHGGLLHTSNDKRGRLICNSANDWYAMIQTNNNWFDRTHFEFLLADRYYFDHKDYFSAFRIYTKYATGPNQNLHRIIMSGICHLLGRGPKQDIPKAIELFNAAYNKGYYGIIAWLNQAHYLLNPPKYFDYMKRIHPNTRKKAEGKLVTENLIPPFTYLSQARTPEEIKFTQLFDSLSRNTLWKNTRDLEALLKGGVDPNVTMLNGYKPILFAVAMGSERYTELLLQYGADPNIFGIIPESDDLTLYTPLQLAIESNKELSDILLAYGADVHYLPPKNPLYYPKDMALSKVLTEAKLPTSKISGYKALELPRHNLGQLGRVIDSGQPSLRDYAESDKQTLQLHKSTLLSILWEPNEIDDNVEKTISVVCGHVGRITNGSKILDDIFKKALNLEKFEFCRILIRYGCKPILEDADLADYINGYRFDKIREYRRKNLQDVCIFSIFERQINFDFGDGGYSMIKDSFIKSLKSRNYHFCSVLVSVGFDIHYLLDELDKYFLNCIDEIDYKGIRFLFSLQYRADRIFYQAINSLYLLCKRNDEYFDVAIFIIMHADALPTLQAKDFSDLGNNLIDILCEKNQWDDNSIRRLKFAVDIGGEFELSNYDGFNILPLQIQRILTRKFNNSLDYLADEFSKRISDQLEPDIYNKLCSKNKLSNLEKIISHVLLSNNLIPLFMYAQINTKVRHEKTLFIEKLKDYLSIIISKVTYFDHETGDLAKEKIKNSLNEFILDYRAQLQTIVDALKRKELARQERHQDLAKKLDQISSRIEKQNQIHQNHINLTKDEARRRAECDGERNQLLKEQIKLTKEEQKNRIARDEEEHQRHLEQMRLMQEQEQNRIAREEERNRAEQERYEQSERRAKQEAAKQEEQLNDIRRGVNNVRGW